MHWSEGFRTAARAIARRPWQGLQVWSVSLVWFALAPALLAVLGSLSWASLPLPNGDRVVEINAGFDLAPGLEHSEAFTAVSRFETGWAVASAGARTERTILVASVDPGFFDVLGLRAREGRVFTASAAEPGGLILTRSAFQALAGEVSVGERGVVRVGGRGLAVIGIVDDRPRYPPHVEAWVLSSDGVRLGSDLLPAGAEWGGMVARLAPATSLVVARAVVSRAAADLERRTHSSGGDVAVVQLDQLYRRRAGGERAFLRVGLVGLLAFVLLAYSVTLSAYVLESRGEFLVRIALGARRADLARLILLRTILLSLPGVVLGTPLAIVALSRLKGVVPIGIAELMPTRIDGEATLFALAGWAAVILLGVGTTWLAMRRVGATDAMMSTIGSNDRGATRLRMVLVTAASALAVALGALAGTTRHAMHELEGTPLGFDPARLSSFVVRLPAAVPAGELVARAGAALRGVEGVEEVGFSDALLFGRPGRNLEITVRDRHESWLAGLRGVSPSYFPAVGLPFVAGRSFTVAEEVNRAPVAVLDVQGARLLFGSGSAIGRTVRLGDRDLEVVGLVPTSRWASLSADPERPQVYRPLGFGGSGEISGAVALLRGSAPDPEDLAEALAGIPAAVSQFERVEAEVDVAMSAHRLAEDASLLHWIAATILVFAATFGTFSWLLRARAFEFAVRMALGETESGIRRRVVRATLTIAVASGVLGILIYLPIAYSLRSFLVTTNPLAPSALAEAAMAVAGVTVAAGLLAMRQIVHGISPDVLREGARRTAL